MPLVLTTPVSSCHRYQVATGVTDTNVKKWYTRLIITVLLHLRIETDNKTVRVEGTFHTHCTESCMTTKKHLIIVVQVGVEVGDGIEAEDHRGHHSPDYCCSRWRRGWRQR